MLIFEFISIFFGIGKYCPLIFYFISNYYVGGIFGSVGFILFTKVTVDVYWTSGSDFSMTIFLLFFLLRIEATVSFAWQPVYEKKRFEF